MPISGALGTGPLSTINDLRLIRAQRRKLLILGFRFYKKSYVKHKSKVISFHFDDHVSQNSGRTYSRPKSHCIRFRKKVCGRNIHTWLFPIHFVSFRGEGHVYWFIQHSACSSQQLWTIYEILNMTHYLILVLSRVWPIVDCHEVALKLVWSVSVSTLGIWMFLWLIRLDQFSYVHSFTYRRCLNA